MKQKDILNNAAPEMYKIICDFIGYYSNGPLEWDVMDEFFHRFLELSEKIEGQSE